MRKSVIHALLAMAMAGAGCIHFPGLKSAGEPARPPAAAVPPKPLTPDDVTPANARQMADELWWELDRAEAENP
jgi:hypothetical protein